MEKTILITGISGFVGGHYTEFLQRYRKNWIIHGISRSSPTWDFIREREMVFEAIQFHQGDLLDSKKMNSLIKEIDPDYILHLAAFSSVGESWKKPVDAFCNNTNAFLNIVESVRLNNSECRILSVGSSEEYGVVNPSILPLTEDYPPHPANPYAVARLSQENLAQIYANGFNINICCTRSFNHIGPGQRDQFVVSSIASQFANLVNKENYQIITIGEGRIIRDFIDIDDVVKAYDAIFIHGNTGETYNVCTGKGYSIEEIVRVFSAMLQIPVQIVQKNSLMRPIDNPIIVGNYNKLHNHTGWEPRIPLETSLRKIYSYWIERRNRGIS